VRLTTNFTVEEMERSNTAIRKGLDNTCPTEYHANMMLVAIELQKVRDHYDAPVRVLSCYRTPAVNLAVGGSPTSAHRYALAADFTVDGVSNEDVARWCAENIPNYDQIINEFPPSGWVHIGFTKNEPRKQLLTAVKDGMHTVYRTGLS